MPFAQRGALFRVGVDLIGRWPFTEDQASKLGDCEWLVGVLAAARIHAIELDPPIGYAAVPNRQCRCNAPALTLAVAKGASRWLLVMHLTATG